MLMEKSPGIMTYCSATESTCAKMSVFSLFLVASNLKWHLRLLGEVTVTTCQIWYAFTCKRNKMANLFFPSLSTFLPYSSGEQNQNDHIHSPFTSVYRDLLSFKHCNTIFGIITNHLVTISYFFCFSSSGCSHDLG